MQMSKPLLLSALTFEFMSDVTFLWQRPLTHQKSFESILVFLDVLDKNIVNFLKPITEVCSASKEALED